MLNNTQRTAWLVGLVGALVLGMPAVGSGQGTVADDRAALEALYDATNGANWGTNTNWNSSAPLDEWHGVYTNANGRVTRLVLYGNGLTGSIPSSLGSLTNLIQLSLSNNDLTGSIPPSLGSLTNLLVLDIANTQLTGSIPSSLGSLTNLENLDLHGTQLTGSIPSSLGSLTNLTDLWLQGNQLTGSIPSSLGSLTNLTQLLLQDNQLTGSIPSSLGNLSNLTNLSLDDNQLSGTIPAELGNLTSLRFLRIDTDTGLCLAPDFDLTSPFATRIRPPRLLDADAGARTAGCSGGVAGAVAGCRRAPAPQRWAGRGYVRGCETVNLTHGYCAAALPGDRPSRYGPLGGYGRPLVRPQLTSSYHSRQPLERQSFLAPIGV